MRDQERAIEMGATSIVILACFESYCSPREGGQGKIQLIKRAAVGLRKFVRKF